MNQFIYHISLLHVQEAEKPHQKFCFPYFFNEILLDNNRSFANVCLHQDYVFEKRKPPCGTFTSLLTLTVMQPPV